MASANVTNNNNTTTANVTQIPWSATSGQITPSYLKTSALAHEIEKTFSVNGVKSILAEDLNTVFNGVKAVRTSSHEPTHARTHARREREEAHNIGLLLAGA